MAGGVRRDVALLVLSNNDRLIHSAKAVGARVRRVNLSVGEVPHAEEDSVPLVKADRFQVNLGKTVLTWDGRASSDSTTRAGQVELGWIAAEERGGAGAGRLALRPLWSRAMIGSLRITGKDEVAKALKASPVHFVGPQYERGSGTLELGGAPRQ
jgi:hypothetical protein